MTGPEAEKFTRAQQADVTMLNGLRLTSPGVAVAPHSRLAFLQLVLLDSLLILKKINTLLK